jgi:hypothetical protein
VRAYRLVAIHGTVSKYVTGCRCAECKLPAGSNRSS